MSNLMRRNRSLLDSLFFPTSLFDDHDDFFESFNDMFKPMKWAKEDSAYPMTVISVKEDGKTVAKRLEYALAGFKKNDIKVTVKDNTLSISAEHKQEPNDNEVVEYNGISYKKLQLSYTLMENADKNGIKVGFDDNILKITIPLKKEEDDTKLIDIE